MIFGAEQHKRPRATVMIGRLLRPTVAHRDTIKHLQRALTFGE